MSEHYLEDLLTPGRANGHLLEINEAMVVDQNALKHLDYRYHRQDADNRLVFRYDSTPHIPYLSSFSQHRHRPESIQPAERPEISCAG